MAKRVGMADLVEMAAPVGEERDLGASRRGRHRQHGSDDYGGAAILFNDSAQAGNAGAGGTGGMAGVGGAGGGNGSGGGSAPAGVDGDEGETGASGVFGTETDDYLDKGATTGAFTINHYFYDFVPHGPGQPSSVDLSGTSPTTFSYEVGEFGGYYAGFPDTGSVGWKVVAGRRRAASQRFVRTDQRGAQH